jgi:hypothetical protein
MSTILTLPDQSTATLPKVSYLNKEYGLKSWLLTGDHKRIAMLYLISITFFFFIGGAMAGLIRLELLTPPIKKKNVIEIRYSWPRTPTTRCLRRTASSWSSCFWCHRCRRRSEIS